MAIFNSYVKLPEGKSHKCQSSMGYPHHHGGITSRIDQAARPNAPAAQPIVGTWKPGRLGLHEDRRLNYQTKYRISMDFTDLSPSKIGRIIDVLTLLFGQWVGF